MQWKEQQRPTQHEFEAAALRFVESDYPGWWQSSRTGWVLQRLGSIYTFQSVPDRIEYTEKRDVDCLRREQRFEGYIPGEEDLSVFAVRQLARYGRLKNR